MPLVTFTYYASPATRYNNSYPVMAGVQSLVYGSTGTSGNTSRHPTLGNTRDKSKSYGLGNVSSTTVIDHTAWESIQSTINSERSRRGLAAATFTAISGTTTINHAHFNQMKTAIQVASNGSDQAYMGARVGESSATGISGPGIVTYGAAGAQSNATTAVATGKIFASDFNNLIKDINNAGAACTCNCNYCSCNCNYCTCNCNYQCTCNCNYSDKRLKTQIRLIGEYAGLNIYSWKYIWDTTKKHIGVIAQELIGTKYEDALSKDNRGFYIVNYDKLPVRGL